MRGKGITYDTGFVVGGAVSREHFDLKQVEHDLAAIRHDLHCTAVRVIGGDPGRIEAAAAIALDLGLEVWFSPYPLELTAEAMLALFADCAERAERLRQRGTVVLVTGAEISIMNPGFLPGDTYDERMALLAQPDRIREALPEIAAKVNAFLARAVTVVRERFHGPVTYASVPIDRVDWTPFDIISMDVYRSAAIAGQFTNLLTAGVRELRKTGKPIAITEFGSATYRGAGDLGAHGLEAIEYEKGTRRPLRMKESCARDEEGQATYLRELLEAFESAGVDSAFVFLFALPGYPHRPDGDPRDDLDRGSYSIVKLFDDPARPWEPKAAFHTLASHYGGPGA